MYEQFMKSKIANRWGTSFKNVINENAPSSCSCVKETKSVRKSEQKSSVSVKTVNRVKGSQSSY